MVSESGDNTTRPPGSPQAPQWPTGHSGTTLTTGPSAPGPPGAGPGRAARWNPSLTVVLVGGVVLIAVVVTAILVGLHTTPSPPPRLAPRAAAPVGSSPPGKAEGGGGAPGSTADADTAGAQSLAAALVAATETVNQTAAGQLLCADAPSSTWSEMRAFLFVPGAHAHLAITTVAGPNDGGGRPAEVRAAGIIQAHVTSTLGRSSRLVFTLHRGDSGPCIATVLALEGAP